MNDDDDDDDDDLDVVVVVVVAARHSLSTFSLGLSEAHARPTLRVEVRGTAGWASGESIFFWQKDLKNFKYIRLYMGNLVLFCGMIL